MKKKVIGKVAMWLAVMAMLVSGVAAAFPGPTAKAATVVSKKGIQGSDFLTVEDVENLDVKHVLLNMHLDECIVTVSGSEKYQYKDKITYMYNGKAYTFTDHVKYYTDVVKKLNQKGITVTMTLLLYLDDIDWNESTDPIQKLIYAKHPNHKIYAWNVDNPEAVETLSALMDCLMTVYTADDCYVENWIVGNEINMPSYYNYTGIDWEPGKMDPNDITKPDPNAPTLEQALEANVDIAAKEFKIVYDVMKQHDDNAKAYICVDHTWNFPECHRKGFKGMPVKDFLDLFHKKVEGRTWNIAYHAYPAVMNSTLDEAQLWNCNYTWDEEDTFYVTGANLSVMTEYVKKNFGENCRILLSEQGYDCQASLDDQAAGVAYTFYAAQFNDMVDGAIFFSYTDDKNDTDFVLGLIEGYQEDLNAAGGGNVAGSEADVSGRVAYINKNKRLVYDVFKHMDKADCKEYVDKYLKTMGKKDWRDLVPKYDPTIFGAEPNTEDYVEPPKPPVEVPDNNTTYFDGSKYEQDGYTGDYGAVYNMTYYLEHNPEVAALFGENPDPEQVLAHFVLYGIDQGLQASLNFSLPAYLCQNPDLLKGETSTGERFEPTEWRDFCLHYIKDGKKERRRATGDYTVEDMMAEIAKLEKEGKYAAKVDLSTMDPTYVPRQVVYRLYNKNPLSGEHLYTTQPAEVRWLVENTEDWVYEGIAWYGPKIGVEVYRLNNDFVGNHLYTSDKNEINILTTNGSGWELDNKGMPLFYSGGETPIYRLYNSYSPSGLHHLSTDVNEYDTLETIGWTKEGIALKCLELGDPNAPLP